MTSYDANAFLQSLNLVTNGSNKSLNQQKKTAKLVATLVTILFLEQKHMLLV